MKLRFSFEKKRTLIAAILILLSCVGAGLVPDVPVRFTLFVCLLFAAAAFLRLELRGWSTALVTGLFACAAALLTVLLCQFVNEMRGAPLKPFYLVLGCLCILFAAVFLHLLMLCFTRTNLLTAVILVSAVFLFLAVANRYTFAFRGTDMTPFDLLSMKTAANVVGSYRLFIDKNIWYAIVFLVVEILAAFSIRTENAPSIARRRIVTLLLILGIGAFVKYSFDRITPNYWSNSGTLGYGFVVNFSRQILDCFAVRPEGYSSTRIEAAEQRFGGEETEMARDMLPHVIVVMNESLADFRVFGEMETSEPVTPFLDSLQEDTVRGLALCSVYGGKTPNSEYEFLTGNTMAFFSPSMIAFSRIQSPSYTLERYLKSLGYESYATHPEDKSNWWRQDVYPLLGFSDCGFEEDYPSAERIYRWAKDKEVYRNLIRRFEASSSDAPLFLYAVTSQNHSPYGREANKAFSNEWPDSEPQPIRLSGYDSEAVGAYLARIHESDRAFGEFVEYFKKVDEPVVILMYGDHHPSEEPGMIRQLYGKDLESLDERELMYEIPYFIWANYDIEERRPELTSINYLSNLLLETAGLPLSPYNRFLKDVQETIPAINAFGYYSRSEGRFQTLEEARGEEAQALLDYETLQYNAVYDKKGRSEFFFPVGD